MDTFSKKLRLKKQLVTIINDTEYDLDYSLDAYLKVFDNVIDDILSLNPDEVDMRVIEDEIYFTILKDNYKINTIYFLCENGCYYNIFTKDGEYVSSRYMNSEAKNYKFTNFKNIFNIISSHFE